VIVRRINNSVFCALFFIASVACASAQNWDGEYVYGASYGDTYGGSPIEEEYRIILDKGKCEIEVAGYQTQEEIVCKAKAEKNSIKLLFKSYKSGELTNPYGIAVYTSGEPLLGLEHVIRDNETRLYTHWFGMKALDEKPRPVGVYFKKLKTSN
jgi:hypothetical protein